MDKKYNPSKYGLTLQRLLCGYYNLDENERASKQFDANFNEAYVDELKTVIEDIDRRLDSKPVRLLTYSSEITDSKQALSPHNFLLADGKTLSIRTTIGTGRVAPRTVGQAGFSTLNCYFGHIFTKEIENQKDLRSQIYNNIHKVLPIFIECFFSSDINLIINGSVKFN